jgi:hypothetical protein
MNRKKRTPKKNPAAVALGRLGGKASAASRSPQERSEGARKAGLARSKKLTAGERRRIAMLGVEARRENRKQREDR